MIRAAVLSLALATPVAAEGLLGQVLCKAVWATIGQELAGSFPASGTVAGMDGDWCVVEAPVIDLQAQYLPDWHADRLRFRGSALNWAVDGTPPPDRLELVVEGLRLVVQTGDPQMDWLFAAQARPNKIDAELALAWDAPGRVLMVETLRVDFPGENLVEFTARAVGVDLSSPGAMQVSATSFAVTEADLRIQTHGLFEWYVLMTLGPSFLPLEGDIEAAAAGLWAEMTAAVAELPAATFPASSKAALTALIAELPNPSGVLTVALRSEAGVGPARVTGYAMTGVPATVAETAPLLEGVTIAIEWTHEDAP